MKEIIPLGRSKIVVGNALCTLEGLLPAQARVIVLSDTNVHRRYKELISRWEYILIPPGEAHKTLATIDHVYGELLALGADRNTFLLAIGGGIVTDIGGLVAATWMRGIDFGFVSTTLLGQVDAGIGGKNGIDLQGYKNMVGTFNQPRFVLCDTEMLATLPQEQMREGMAEIVKAGVVGDAALFELLETRDFSTITREAIVASIRVKTRIVEQDEREAGLRKLLNLGHTFAHAIEKQAPEYTHGRAVAIGLAIIADLSVNLGLLSPTHAARITALLTRLGLPATSPIAPRELLASIAKDKKRFGEQIDLVLIRAIGSCEIRRMSLSEIEKVVD